MSAEIHVGDVGTVIRITVKDENDTAVDVSGATVTKTFKFLKPDGTTVLKAASFNTDGVNGILKYTTLAADIDQSGVWKVQVNVVLAGATWYSTWGEFVVHGNI
jgi:hypothetical protein